MNFMKLLVMHVSVWRPIPYSCNCFPWLNTKWHLNHYAHNSFTFWENSHLEDIYIFKEKSYSKICLKGRDGRVNEGGGICTPRMTSHIKRGLDTDLWRILEICWLKGSISLCLGEDSMLMASFVYLHGTLYLLLKQKPSPQFYSLNINMIR